mmetsp:Transcript_18463/g.28320  ORF Transcript_18463/g.28320 Transcript_18463/m.28320 type:complete len:166 (-) Transcript_18463:1031-1528(-)|eukprot:CAMPEP_0170482532 /NCGR_PEP_ID=MMETSP0208-20121228/2511_1 /TAXON_ID=197538 /ORGANISM="Strombidium inclinatum, Strain S3" /LENGTH=165 /DNA_ID=CAMNT_0010755381 /DNA_START=274 /DNA_END=771 /DNA_ORIENTATION=-
MKKNFEEDNGVVVHSRYEGSKKKSHRSKKRKQADPEEDVGLPGFDLPEIQGYEPENHQSKDLFFTTRENVSSTSTRLIDSIESRQRISGCLFGFVGSIVLAFAIYLIHSGRVSKRSEEVQDYLDAVYDWNNGGMALFSSLEISVDSAEGTEVDISKLVGEKRSES